MLGHLCKFKVRVRIEEESKFIEICKKHNISVRNRVQRVQNYAICDGSADYECHATDHNYFAFAKELGDDADLFVAIIP